MTTAQIAVWDFRMNVDRVDAEKLKTFLAPMCKKWVFQLERGETTGYVHWQGRMSLVKKKRKTELMKAFEDKGVPVPNYLEPTTNELYRTGDMFYAMKEDTRVEGPWTDKDVQKYIPRQYRDKLDRLYPFQKVVWDSADQFDDRIINMIYCEHGSSGKSTIAALTELFGRGVDLPPVNDAEKLVQSACDICMSKDVRNPSPFFVDLPRAMNKDRLNGIYTAIEQMKKGKLYDLRHHYKEYWIDSPAIWVFSNIEPELRFLSRDRWRVWEINERKEFVPYVPRPRLEHMEADDGAGDNL